MITSQQGRIVVTAIALLTGSFSAIAADPAQHAALSPAQSIRPDRTVDLAARRSATLGAASVTSRKLKRPVRYVAGSRGPTASGFPVVLGVGY